MKTLAITLGLLMAPLLNPEPLVTYQTDKAQSTMAIEGTSTLHDWTVKAEDLRGTMDVDRFEKRLAINALQLTVPVETLESGKSPMNSNMYEALKSEEHPQIKYGLTEVLSQEWLGQGEVKLTTRGQLSIAGKTRTMDIPVRAVLSDEGVTLKGSSRFKMSSFGVEPPSFMFGSVTTGDYVTVNFSLRYN
ncbi:MAG: YceI family protein [Schleiferiaceae bacterium]|nr:YceI family protein [Schleiferiaceae bacterium]MDR9442152.1 YceI family protein [Schleiferiaceae bacterium]